MPRGTCVIVIFFPHYFAYIPEEIAKRKNGSVEALEKQPKLLQGILIYLCIA